MRPKRIWLWLAAAACTAAPWAAGQTIPSHPPEAASHPAALDQAFEKQLNHATLVGFFSSSDSDKPSQDQYTIVKITKKDGDDWMFIFRMKIAGKEAELPIILPVKWAGDTPVITVTDVGIPGLGTYTARVMIYKDHYAGMWSGKDHGGEMWGRIIPEGAATHPAPPATLPATAPVVTPATQPSGGTFQLNSLWIGAGTNAVNTTAVGPPATQPRTTSSDVPVYIHYESDVLQDFGIGHHSPAEIDDLVHDSATATQPAH